MGRLDENLEGELVQVGPGDDLDDLEPVDDLPVLEAGELDAVLDSMHHVAMGKSSRRRLEDRLEDLRLQHQINDYDVKL